MNSRKRVRYVDGQILSAADFQAEQQYLLDRHRLHNLSCHGLGVISGLKVSVSTDGSADDSVTVHVSPGLAIDCLGDELHVPQPFVQVLQPPDEDVYVCVLMTETATDFVPRIGAGADDEHGTEATRIEESVVLTCELADPCAGHPVAGKRKTRTPCGKRHAISVAYLKKKGHGWKLERKFRPCCEQMV